MSNQSLLVGWRKRWNRSLLQFLGRRARATIDIEDLAGEPAVVAASPSSSTAAPAQSRGLDYGERNGKRYDVWSIAAGKTTNLTRLFRSSTINFVPAADGGALVATDGRLWDLTIDSPPKALSSATGPQITGLREPIIKAANGRLAVRLRVRSTTDDADQDQVFDLHSKSFLLPDAAPRTAMTVATASHSMRRAIVIRSDHDATNLLVLTADI